MNIQINIQTNIQTLMQTHTNTASLSNVLRDFAEQNINHEFHWTTNGFASHKGKVYHCDDLEVKSTLRFESLSNAKDCSIIILETKDGLKGYMLYTGGIKINRVSSTHFDSYILKHEVFH